MKNRITAFLVFLFLLPGLLVAQSADTKNADGNGFFGPDISVTPLALSQIHFMPPEITTDYLTITNMGDETLYWEIGFGGTNKSYQHEVVSARSAGNLEIIWDNGPIVTAEGAGSNGSDYSELQDATLSMSVYGSGCQLSAGNLIADDFEITGDRDLAQFTFYVYQTGAGNVSTINDIRYLIYDGNPTQGGQVIYGDLEINRLLSSSWTNVWRVLESAPTENRAIMEVVADAAGLSLSPGTYWVAFQAGGTGASGPWCPPVTITGQTNTGNSLQYTSSGSWEPLIDVSPQGMPFLIEAYPGPLVSDVGIFSILQPASGVIFTDEEPVTIRIKNYGAETQTSIPYVVNWSGPTGTETVEGIYEGSLAYNQTVDVTLEETVDLTVSGFYTFEACTLLEDDQNSANDCKTKVLYAPPPGTEWLAPESSAGVIYPGGTIMVGIIFNSENLAPGIYRDSLWIESNAPSQPLIIIPAELVVNPVLQPPSNLTARLDQSGQVILSWIFTWPDSYEHINIYRNGELVGTTTDTLFTDQLPDFGKYNYKVTAQYSIGESLPAGPVLVKWKALPIVTVSPLQITEKHLCPPLVTTHSLTISNSGSVPLDWQIYLEDNSRVYQKSVQAPGSSDVYNQDNLKSLNLKTRSFLNDVGVSAIIKPTSGVDLSHVEPVEFIIKNYGTNTLTDIPWEVSWSGPTGSGSIEGIYSGSLMPDNTIAIVPDETVNLFVYGTYQFTFCTLLPDDSNSENDCMQQSITNKEASLAWENLYSTGCDLGDGLTYWELNNILVPDIPCEGTPSYYHDYTGMAHELAPGHTYLLKVEAGTSNTYFDVWINYNDDDWADNTELLLDDGFCQIANEPYTFQITIPEIAPSGKHILRYRTNTLSPVEHFSQTYLLGNCCDFSARISDDIEWLSVDSYGGTVEPGQKQQVTITFNSEGLLYDNYPATVVVKSREPLQPLIEIPVEFTVSDEPALNYFPEDYFFELFPGETQTDLLSLENLYSDTINVSISITFLNENPEYDWLTVSPENAQIPPDETATFEVTAISVYTWNSENYATIHVTSDDPCASSVEIPVRLDVMGAVNENERAPQISIFPNPAHSSLNISSRKPIHSVALMNQLGEICIDKVVDAPATTLPVAGLPKGIYVLKIINQEGQFYHKVVVQ
ncbi:MAG: T9SS type A sorting domain-containing protein [Bacteroidales bacterium]|nr:T9SS type A sorting domain-containing protein [Bacteroidales bacterium]MDD4176978.1 T9SS type A sorting domain-containing protein [Bacteroidales bacterium]MDD4740349.1 T9SS type A sorting domain-containing protein [Bacteroidales bacterium]